MSLSARTTLGRYRILEPLGAGGMGEVWVAEDATLRRRVALKVLPDAVSRDRDRLARFQREAEALAALSHPGIVTVYSIEEDDGIRYLSMELVEGQTLDKALPRGGFPLSQVLDIGIQLADALAASHEKGIVHRDLKPANLMLTARGRRLKVLDFGLAKLLDDVESEGETRTTVVSGEGRIVGTAAYMSPEQAEGRPLDSRSDLFSLGVVLYEIATGARPFRGDTSVSLLSAILRDTPKSVTGLRADLPREFGRIVRRCLQKDPEERYQTAKDVRNDLRALRADLESGEVSTEDAAERHGGGGLTDTLSRPWTWVALALVVAAVSIGYLVLANAARREPSFGVATTPRKLTTHGRVGVAAISPDGKYVAYSIRAPGTETLVLRQVETSIDRTVLEAAPVNYEGVTFTPDNSHIYYVSRIDGAPLSVLYRVSVLGGQPTRVIEGVDSPITLSPDGRRLAFVRRTPGGASALMTVNADGTGLQPLTTRKAPDVFSVGGPAWSPDGELIVTSLGTQADVAWEVLEVAATRGSERQVTHAGWGDARQLAWYPDGKR